VHALGFVQRIVTVDLSWWGSSPFTTFSVVVDSGFCGGAGRGGPGRLASFLQCFTHGTQARKKRHSCAYLIVDSQIVDFR
jgi:hypothetical protein